ncbi:hypothetical protein CANCADRAFT_71142 [Tortispora caseinolytica NRRL Y-17796]|uniref:Uncharacterized protein n=1 Tax=Tortispora caseinolytica NRRL Y-17796 TaxID=767744 RepID=A0A1E4TI79_9ASCO|nr:hypothetical protein CANCADRAFT_71142 [Tortispora caseinolytica NRRL Y-17796]
MPKSRPFINKKESLTFDLVPRRRDDVLYYDEEAAPNVMMPQYRPATYDDPNARKTRRQRQKFYHEWNLKYDRDLDKPADIDDLEMKGVLDSQNESQLTTYDDGGLLMPGGGSAGEAHFRQVVSRLPIKDLSEAFPSTENTYMDYENMKDVPDELAYTDDPDLLEILEALDDDRYLAQTFEIPEPKENDQQALVRLDAFLDAKDEPDKFFDEILESGPADWRSITYIKDIEKREQLMDQYEAEYYGILEQNPSGHSDQRNLLLKDNALQEVTDTITKLAIDEDHNDDEHTEKAIKASIESIPKKTVVSKKSTKITIQPRKKKVVGRGNMHDIDKRFEHIQREYDSESDEEQSNYDPDQGFDLSEERPDFEDVLDSFLNQYDVIGKHIVLK